MESDVVSFTDVVKLFKRAASENQNVFFPSVTCRSLSCLQSVNGVISNKIVR